jgi:hypothetical protein
VKVIRIEAPTSDAHKARALLEGGTDISEYICGVHIDITPGLSPITCQLDVIACGEFVAKITGMKDA